MSLPGAIYLGGEACAVARGPALTLWCGCKAANELLRKSMAPAAYRGLSDEHALLVQEVSREVASAIGIRREEIRRRQFIEVYPFARSLAPHLVAGSRYALEVAAKRLRQFENLDAEWRAACLAALSDGIHAKALAQEG